jgi:HEAT repeat protein
MRTEEELIAVLRSDAAVKEKADACRQLARVGTGNAVPALAGLLGDEVVSHMARYALETIADPRVDAALRAALGELKGRRLAGAIGSVGVRRDLSATPALVTLLGDPDPVVARAAARALGRFGTGAAAKALDDALGKAPAATRRCVVEGLLRCAEALAAGGDRKKATAVYDRLRALERAPHQVRTAAVRGAVLSRGEAGMAVLLEALRSKDSLLISAAARTSLEMPGTAVTEALAAALPELRTAGQVLLIGVLGKRGDPAAVRALEGLERSGSEAVREAAARALKEIEKAAAPAGRRPS